MWVTAQDPGNSLDPLMTVPQTQAYPGFLDFSTFPGNKTVMIPWASVQGQDDTYNIQQVNYMEFCVKD